MEFSPMHLCPHTDRCCFIMCKPMDLEMTLWAILQPQATATNEIFLLLWHRQLLWVVKCLPGEMCKVRLTSDHFQPDFEEEVSFFPLLSWHYPKHLCLLIFVQDSEAQGSKHCVTEVVGISSVMSPNCHLYASRPRAGPCRVGVVAPSPPLFSTVSAGMNGTRSDCFPPTRIASELPRHCILPIPSFSSEVST